MTIPKVMAPSPFNLPENILGRDRAAFAWANQFPVTDGHILILPKRDIVSVFDLNRDEIISHMKLAKRAVTALDKFYKPDGYIMGWNDGVAGGQSVAHAHMHIMPCYAAVNATHKLNRRGGGLRMRHLNELPEFYHKSAGTVVWPDDARLKTKKTVGPVAILQPIAPITTQHVLLHHANMNNRDQRPYLKPRDTVEMFDALHAWRKTQRSMTAPPDGYNIVWNMGLAAGQIYSANIMEVVSRWHGDAPNPRGGITTSFPDLSDYYDPKNAGTDVPIKQPVRLKFQRI